MIKAPLCLNRRLHRRHPAERGRARELLQTAVRVRRPGSAGQWADHAHIPHRLPAAAPPGVSVGAAAAARQAAQPGRRRPCSGGGGGGHVVIQRKLPSGPVYFLLQMLRNNKGTVESDAHFNIYSF